MRGLTQGPLWSDVNMLDLNLDPGNLSSNPCMFKASMGGPSSATISGSQFLLCKMRMQLAGYRALLSCQIKATHLKYFDRQLYINNDNNSLP